MNVLLLNGNQIVDISQISKLTNLNDLWLHNNEISDLSPLSEFEIRSGGTFNLRGNPITDWSPVAHIRNVDGRP